MATQTAITTDQAAGVTYYSTERNGIEYTCYLASYGEWCLHSKRKALGRSNMGSCRHYPDVYKLAASVKAFAMLPALLQPAPTETAH